MRRSLFLLVIATVVLAAAGCEPTNTAVAPPASTTPVSSSGASAAASQAPGASAAPAGSSAGQTHAPGTATVTTSGTAISIGGHGPILKTPIFVLPGNVVMKLSTCGSNGTFPFIWLYTEFNSTVGQYVEEVTHIKVTKGNYYLHVVSPPDCEWTVNFTAE